ncbi:MAG: thrombospondin type 3 repeat-containing protein [Candidatus Nanohaloarchaea archaeon]
MKHKTTILTITLLLTAGIASAQSTKLPADQVATNQNTDTQFSNQELHPAEKQGLLDLQLSFLLSTLNANKITVPPGGKIGFNSEVDILNSFKTENAYSVFTVYDCGDSDCNNPPQEDINGDNKVDSCQIEGDVRQGKDDCINSISTPVSDLYPLRTGLADGETLESSIDYTLDSDADTGTYIAETYIWTTTNSIVSDTPSEKFTVEEQSDGGNDEDDEDDGESNRYDSDGDGVYNSNDQCKYEFGNKDNGCPDTDYDKDGVKNTADACPNTFGEKENGCPVKDSDNDGVINAQDNCPDKKGVLSNNGCPKPENPFPVIPAAIGLLALLMIGGAAIVKWR